MIWIIFKSEKKISTPKRTGFGFSRSSECCKWDIPLRSALVNTELWQPWYDIWVWIFWLLVWVRPLENLYYWTIVLLGNCILVGLEFWNFCFLCHTEKGGVAELVKAIALDAKGVKWKIKIYLKKWIVKYGSDFFIKINFYCKNYLF